MLVPAAVVCPKGSTRRAVRVPIAAWLRYLGAVLRAEARWAGAGERIVTGDDSRNVRADATVLAYILLVPAAVVRQGAAGATADRAFL